MSSPFWPHSRGPGQVSRVIWILGPRLGLFRQKSRGLFGVGGKSSGGRPNCQPHSSLAAVPGCFLADGGGCLTATRSSWRKSSGLLAKSTTAHWVPLYLCSPGAPPNNSKQVYPTALNIDCRRPTVTWKSFNLLFHLNLNFT